MELNPKQHEKILQKVAELVRKKYFHPDFDVKKWQGVIEEKKPFILQTSDSREFEKEMHNLVSQLGTSHTAFFHRNLRPLPSRQAICTTFKQCETREGLFWMVQDVQEFGPGHRAGLESGDLLLKVNDEKVISEKPPAFRVRGSTSLIVRKRDGKEKRISLEIPKFESSKRPFAMPRPALWSLRESGIGYLKVNMFPGVVGIDVAKDIDRAISDFRGCERLIIDLRGNSGGGIGGLRLMSYLTPHKVPVGYSLSRRRASSGYKKEKLPQFGRIPSSKWVLPWLVLKYALRDKSIVVVTEGLGPQPFHGRVLILVNQHSASASEIIAAFAAENKLAKIVGTRTPGRLVASRRFKLPYGYFLILPVGMYLTWRGEKIEGKGVRPDFPVDLSYEALLEGRDNQLEKAMEVVRHL
ncbi:S41 family peptidase [Acidobacteria bacterium AH-259-G07]|nr:S41 family peptidase [Acidobacteria bacterium AH-259-G07]